MTATGRSLRGATVAALLALTCTAAELHSQTAPTSANWPQRPVRFILPLGPGSGVDLSARLLAEKLAPIWRQSVVVENRPGGDGVLAIVTFIGSRDDHAILMTPASSFTAHPWLHDRLPYDADDLVPIARISNSVVAVAVPASLAVNSIAELVAYARRNPGKLNRASITGLFDFMFAGFLKKHDLDIVKVPYRDTVQAVDDLREDRIQIVLAAIAILRPHMQAGKIKLLAVTAHERSSIAPGIPTMLEEGFPELAIDGLTGLFGPRGTSNDLRERIAADVVRVLGDPQVRARLLATAQIVNPGGAAEFTDAIGQQRAQAAAVGRLLGIKPASR